MSKIYLTTLAFLLSINAIAKEGMWIPLLIEKYNIEEMLSMGFKLTAEDIYSINQACMKDAVMIFGSGCTGALISDKGLLITNHHCGYAYIQKHSSVEFDYLANGFWAMSNDDELPNQGLKVTFLKRMEDVTNKVLENVSDDMNMEKRKEIINKNISQIRKESVENTHFTAQIESFFHNNQYYLFINEEFTDVRLVGAPPSSIGKFGGDSDNWTWPRHTGDFSLFRIYADKDNQPAHYSADNVPYKSPAFFPISLKGYEEGDFTMVFGYPGSTFQYVPSYHIEMLTELVYPKLIDLRTAKLDIMNRYMATDRAVRIQYASKNANLANSWKRWKGEIRGLAKLDAINKKQTYESDFQRWVNEDEMRKSQFGSLLSDYKIVYEEYFNYRLVRDYFTEFIGRFGLETVRIAGSFSRLKTLYSSNEPSISAVEAEKSLLQEQFKTHFKDFYLPIDKETAVVAINYLINNISAEFYPDIIENINKKYKGNIEKYIETVYSKTIFTDATSTTLFVNQFNNKSIKNLNADPTYELYRSIHQVYQNKIVPRFNELQNKLDSLNRIYMAALMEFDTERKFFPDANFTLRVSYGDIRGYEAADAVYFKYYTTLDGIIEKEDSDIYDYTVPERLKELYKNKDFGKYEFNGSVPVAFVATNHTTGGNSGSPVVNSNGELIGVNFDRAWEGVMSDLMFNPDQCRNISIDIRYALFIIDKYANAGYLLEEMKIVE